MVVGYGIGNIFPFYLQGDMRFARIMQYVEMITDPKGVSGIRMKPTLVIKEVRFYTVKNIRFMLICFHKMLHYIRQYEVLYVQGSQNNT